MIFRSAILCVTFVLGGALAMTTSCTQPLLNCTTAHGQFAAEYTLITGDRASSCAQLRGDVLGMSTYFQPGGPNNTPNYQDAKVAIRPLSLGLMIAYAEARGIVEGDETFYDANALGSFTAGFPNDDGFCMAQDFEPARVTLPLIEAVADDPATPEVDEARPEQPAIDVVYRWTNARFVVTADAQGTQFEADLEVEQDDCRASYHVVGLYPAVTCETDAQCEDEANGINPDFAVRCNVDIGFCVLDGELPAYEDAG